MRTGLVPIVAVVYGTINCVFLFFFNDTATTEIYTLFPTRRSSDLTADLSAVRTMLMQTYGVVFRPVSWGSVFLNTSENSSLPPGRYGPNGNPLAGRSE